MYIQINFVCEKCNKPDCLYIKTNESTNRPLRSNQNVAHQGRFLLMITSEERSLFI